jgi:NTP pyrophosphatase (non-canonical NTP hydrolase)
MSNKIKDVMAMKDEIHKNAISHGWWPGERSVSELFALIQSEISEALEGYRNGDNENICEEYADIAIRLLDFLSGMEEGKIKPGVYDGSLPSQICLLHTMAMAIMFQFPNTDQVKYRSHLLIEQLVKLCEDLGTDLLAEIKAKHAKNIKRPWRHGGKKA